MKDEKKQDRRTVYTKRVIREAFMDALRKKNHDRITVSELCTAADINRSTFYLHYETVYSVFEELLGELLTEMTSAEDQSLQDTSDLLHFGNMSRARVMNDPDKALLLSQGFTYPRFIEQYSEETARLIVPYLKGAPELSEEQRVEVVKALLYADAMLNKAFLEHHSPSELESYNDLINRYIILPAMEKMR